MVKLKEEFQLSNNFNLNEYDNYMEKKPLEQRIMLDFIINSVKCNKNIKILEFGAGTSRFTKNILEIFPKIQMTIVEPDKLCCIKLKKLKKKYPQIKIVQSSVENFTSTTSYDIIVIASAFHHIPFKSKLISLNNTRKLLDTNGIFLCGDNFIAEYKTMKEREIILRKSIDKWIKDSKNDKKELKMAINMKKIIFKKDFGGEYFICPSIFESYLNKSNLIIKGKINVTNTDSLDFENYFYLIKK